MMLKNSVFFGLIALAIACSDNNDKADITPAPPVNTAAPATPNLPLLTPITVESKDLSDDFGFQAVYSKFPFALSHFPEAEALVNVTRNRVQLRKLDNREILDCHFGDHTLKSAEYRLEGEIQPPDAFMWISCLTLHDRVMPINNVDELCDVFGCMDEKIGETETRKIVDQTLWIEKESHVRVQEGQDLHMKQLVPGKPADSEFKLNP